MKILLFIFLGLAASYKLERNEPNYLASIRQSPSIFKRCSASFIAPDYLLSTASCFLCDQNCTFQVATNPVRAGKADALYDVETVFMNPNYFNHTDSHNIAVIKLTKPAENVEILKIVNTTKDDSGVVSVWGFNQNMTEFSLTNKPFKKASKTMCLRYANLDINEDELCLQTTEPTAMGPLNLGVPFVKTGEHSDFKFLGFRNRVDGLSPAKVYTFTSIAYYYDWIMGIIKDNPNRNSKNGRYYD